MDASQRITNNRLQKIVNIYNHLSDINCCLVNKPFVAKECTVMLHSNICIILYKSTMK